MRLFALLGEYLPSRFHGSKCNAFISCYFYKRKRHRRITRGHFAYAQHLPRPLLRQVSRGGWGVRHLFAFESLKCRAQLAATQNIGLKQFCVTNESRTPGKAGGQKFLQQQLTAIRKLVKKGGHLWAGWGRPAANNGIYRICCCSALDPVKKALRTAVTSVCPSVCLSVCP